MESAARHTGLSTFKAFALLALLTTITSLPAISGDFVYDDTMMIGHPYMDGFDDALSVFSRGSDVYIGYHQKGDAAITGASTYRPLPMLTLIATNAVFGMNPLVHHCVSLLLHLLSIFMLLGLTARQGRIGYLPVALIALFAMHPVLGESYQWINGRSDTLAGLAVLTLAAQLRARASIGRIFIILLSGSLCKLTFLPAAAAVIGARYWRRPEAEAKTRLLHIGMAFTVAAGLFFVAHRLVQPALAAAPLSGPQLKELIQSAPQLLGLALERILVPLPGHMRLLAWDLDQPWSTASMVLLCLAVGTFLFCAFRRRYSLLILTLGACLSLIPTALVAQSFWLGFDRYLYLPMCLLAIGLIWTLPERGDKRLFGVVVVLVSLVGYSNYLTASHYENQTEFCQSLIDGQPDAPTGYLLSSQLAYKSGAPDAGHHLMKKMPSFEHGLPAPLAHRVAEGLLRSGLNRRATEVIERAFERSQDHPKLKFDMLSLRASQGRWDEVLQLAQELVVLRGEGDAVVTLIRSWLTDQRLPVEMRGGFNELLVRHGPPSKNPD